MVRFGAAFTIIDENGDTQLVILDSDRPPSHGVTINPVTGALTALPTTGNVTVITIYYDEHGSNLVTNPIFVPKVNRASEQIANFEDSTVRPGDLIAIDLNDYFTNIIPDDLTFSVNLTTDGFGSTVTRTLTDGRQGIWGLTINPDTGMLT